jgi:hypothetical protein
MALWITGLILAMIIGGYVFWGSALGISIFQAHRGDATKRILRARYLQMKEGRQDAQCSEEDILLDVLRTRPQYLGQDNPTLRQIVQRHPNIDALASYVVDEEKRARNKKP